MSKPRFVGIGKLGGRDAAGYHHVMIKPEYRELFFALDEVYLIFDSDRVFFVTITDKKKSEKKLWISFAEDGIDTERRRHREVILAIRDSRNQQDTLQLKRLASYQVLHEGEPLGVIEGNFDNGAQEVLVIRDADGCEILVPDVPHYVKEIRDSQKTIVIHNAADLIAFYRKETKGRQQ